MRALLTHDVIRDVVRATTVTLYHVPELLPRTEFLVVRDDTGSIYREAEALQAAATFVYVVKQAEAQIPLIDVECSQARQPEDETC